MPDNDKIMNRVRAHGRGKWVCTPEDFLDLGTRDAIDQALSILVKRGQLRRVGRGQCDWPQTSRLLKQDVPPDCAGAPWQRQRVVQQEKLVDGM